MSLTSKFVFNDYRNPGIHNIITEFVLIDCIHWLLFMTIHHVFNFIFSSTLCTYYSLFTIHLWCFDLYLWNCASFYLLDWTASTRSMWRSAWLQASAPQSRSSLLSTTRWKWNMPLSWWKVEGESNYRLLCLLLFPCSTYHFIAPSSSNSLNLLLLVLCQQKLATIFFNIYYSQPKHWSELYLILCFTI